MKPEEITALPECFRCGRQCPNDCPLDVESMELEPCPLCGGKPYLHIDEKYAYTYWKISCYCGLSFPEHVIESKGLLIKSWNTRTNFNVRHAKQALSYGLDKSRYDHEDAMETKTIHKWYWRYVQNLETNAKKAMEWLTTAST